LHLPGTLLWQCRQFRSGTSTFTQIAIVFTAVVTDSPESRNDRKTIMDRHSIA